MIVKASIDDLSTVNLILSYFNCSNIKEYNNDFLLYKINNKTIALINYQILIDEIEIYYLYVDEDYRRKGIATTLMNHIINKFIGYKFYLELRESNHNAMNFYKKFGFEIINIRKKYYKNEDGIVLERSIR